MELRHLRYFVALAETLHFTRAAEKVHVTQSTLSQQIRHLEEELRQPLFERIGKRVVLSEAGEKFLAYAGRALREVDQGVTELRSGPGEMAGELRIGATHTFNMGFVPESLSAFMRKYPRVRVGVWELAADAIAESLLSGGLQVGIAYEPKDTSNLWFEPLYTEEMVLAVAPDHPLAERKRVRFAELHRQRLVLLPREFATRGMLEEYFRQSGVDPLVAAEMNTIASMISLVSRTDLAAIVSERALDHQSGVVAVPLESPTPVRTPGLLWKRGVNQSAAAASFAASVRKLALTKSLRARITKTELGNQ